MLGISEVFTPRVAEVAVALSGACDPEVAANAARIYSELEGEETRFRRTLAAGEKLLKSVLKVSCTRLATEGTVGGSPPTLT